MNFSPLPMAARCAPTDTEVSARHPPLFASIAKESDSGAGVQMVFSSGRNHGKEETRTMSQKTCAACDCELDQNSIKVKLGGKTVEVCCEECAAAIGEAEAARTAAASAGK